MSHLGHALIAPLLLALSLGALASGVDTYEFRHPERQTRAQELARALRCPQCQNQNLVESNSPIARDLRLEVYRWVDEGQSDEQVIARMTERFGDFVRYDPPFKRSTALLWGGPALLLLLALNRLRRSLHRRQPARVPLVGDRAEGVLAHDPANEPDIAYAHLFSYFKGEEWRTQKELHRLLQKYFKNAPDGIPGNDDTGTMSAWAIFNMMGFYPDCPGEPAYTLSTPVFDKVTIKLDPKYWGRDQLVIETERPSAESLYIREMELGGKKLSRYRITHEELVQSGKLRFRLR
jgi:formate-dependent nitrite reductase complex subunit NrfG